MQCLEIPNLSPLSALVRVGFEPSSIGHGFKSQPGQSFSLSLCGLIYLTRSKLGISKHCNLPLKNYMDLSVITQCYTAGTVQGVGLRDC